MRVSTVFPWRAAAFWLAAAFGLSACDQPVRGAEEEAARPVKLITVEAATLGPDRAFPGRVRAAQTAVLSFQVGGRVEEIPVLEGEEIAEGDLVAKLDDTDFRLALQEAEARFRDLERQLDRQETLLERGHVPQSAVDTVRAQYEMAEADLAQARQNLEYTRIEAPFDGVVAQRHLEAHRNVASGTTVATLHDLSAIEVVIDLPEQILATMQRYDIVHLHVRFEADPTRSYPLTFKEYATQADSATQTYRVTLTTPPPEEIQVLPGMSATVEARALPVGGDDPALAPIRVPAEAVVAGPEGGFQVWIYDAEQGRARARPVEVGVAGAERITIREGLEAGERIVAAGAQFVHDGMAVRPLDNRD